jgi:endonuclease/exonuclease/phosphatase family metal-dependent hydrolase
MFRKSALLRCILSLVLLGGCLELSAQERVRIMAANTTSGNFQSYDPGHGTRIFQGLDPDIVLIQEFNFGNNSSSTIRGWVDSTFGSDFDYYREGGGEQIPNGVISRFPIVASGEWNDSLISNRDYAWARIDIPGNRHLWVVSVHLKASEGSTQNAQAQAIVAYVQANVPQGDYLVIGGDFNTSSRGASAINTFSQVVVTGAPWPVDQSGDGDTNASRAKPYDWVLAGPDFDALETSVVIGSNSFPNGLVFDSRVYSPLSDVAPVQSGDSGASNMQHMAVIRDFLVGPNSGLDPEPSAYPTGFMATPGSNSIALQWTDATGGTAPAGYLIRASAFGVPASPSDGVEPTQDANLADGQASYRVEQGVESMLFTGLPESTNYTFRIFPYSNSGSAIDYKTDGAIPTEATSTLGSGGGGQLPAVPEPGPVIYPFSGGFTLTWESVPEAQSYRLDIATDASFASSPGGVILSEDFDASQDVPAGWINGGSDRSSVDSHYGSAPNCRAMGQGDDLTTPLVDNPVQLSFYVDASNNGDGQTGTVEYRIGGGSWQALASFTAEKTGNTETIDLTNSPDLSSEASVQFRFRSTFFTWYLDDVVVEGAGNATIVDGFDDLDVGSVDYFGVDGLQASTTYYARLRSINASGSSSSSNVITAQTTATGTAFSNWAQGKLISNPVPGKDSDGDGGSDFREFAFATNPRGWEPVADWFTYSIEPDRVRVTFRRAKIPGVEWNYLWSEDLDDFGDPLVEGTERGRYTITGERDFDEYKEIDLEVNTSGASHSFFRIQVIPVP